MDSRATYRLTPAARASKPESQRTQSTEREDFVGASRWRVWSSLGRYVDALTAVARSAIASSLSETWGYSHNHFSFRFPTRHHQAGVRGRSRHRKQGFPPQSKPAAGGRPHRNGRKSCCVGLEVRGSGTDQTATLWSRDRLEVESVCGGFAVPATEFDPRRLEGIALCRPQQRGARVVGSE